LARSHYVVEKNSDDIETHMRVRVGRSPSSLGWVPGIPDITEVRQTLLLLRATIASSSTTLAAFANDPSLPRGPVGIKPRLSFVASNRQGPARQSMPGAPSSTTTGNMPTPAPRYERKGWPRDDVTVPSTHVHTATTMNENDAATTVIEDDNDNDDIDSDQLDTSEDDTDSYHKTQHDVSMSRPAASSPLTTSVGPPSALKTTTTTPTTPSTK
jgi:hypothetical protein